MSHSWSGCCLCLGGVRWGGPRAQRRAEGSDGGAATAGRCGLSLVARAVGRPRGHQATRPDHDVADLRAPAVGIGRGWYLRADSRHRIPARHRGCELRGCVAARESLVSPGVSRPRARDRGRRQLGDRHRGARRTTPGRAVRMARGLRARGDPGCRGLVGVRTLGQGTASTRERSAHVGRRLRPLEEIRIRDGCAPSTW